MRRFLRFVSIALALWLFSLAAAALAFDRFTVAPALGKAAAMYARATPSEKNLSPIVRRLAMASIGSDLRLWCLVSRDLLSSPPSQIEEMRTIEMQLTELSVGLLLPVHLTNNEMLALFVSRAGMGEGTRGFSQASAKYLGMPLENVTPEQAARLVAISHAPTAYIDSPERLQQATQRLLRKVAL